MKRNNQLAIWWEVWRCSFEVVVCCVGSLCKYLLTLFLGPISPTEYILEYIRERLNRCADWLETASGGCANQSARGFQFSEYIREYIHLVKPGQNTVINPRLTGVSAERH